MTQYLELEDALSQVARVGFHVKDLGLLDSALARPRTSLFGEDAYPSLSLKVAALMHSVIKNQPMVDGNKRTSWLLVNAFLYINGYLFEASTEEGLELTLGVAKDKLNLEDSATFIDVRLVESS